MLTEKEAIIFEILKQTLLQRQSAIAIGTNDQKQQKLSSDVDWEQIFQEMSAQTVAALAVDWIVSNPTVEAELKRKWRNAAVITVRRWLQVMSGQEELTKLLDREQIEFAIIKGAAAAICYPDPAYRTMGDVDFIVKKERIREVYELLLKNGYENFGCNEISMTDKEDLEHFHHVELMKNGVEFELHWGLPLKRQSRELEARISELLHEGLDHTEVRMLEGYHVVMFPMALNGLILLRHIMQHLQDRNLGLRQIVDWMMFVNENLDDETWEQGFCQVMQTAGLEALAIHVTRMCQLYLGLREDGISWCGAAEPHVCGEILGCVMEVGNYGLKAAESDRGMRTMMKYRNIFSLLKSLHSNGMKNWDLAGRYFFLRPFAGVYQAGRYIKLTFQKEAPLKSLSGIYRKSKRHESMLRSLNIERVSD